MTANQALLSLLGWVYIISMIFYLYMGAKYHGTWVADLFLGLPMPIMIIAGITGGVLMKKMGISPDSSPTIN